MLDIQNLTVGYGLRRVLEAVDLTAAAGQVLVVAGPNGAGKSTLIKAISGVLPIERGRVLVRDRDVSHLSTAERARQMAVVPQARSLPAAFTVYEAVLLGRTPYLGWLGRPHSRDHQRVRQALESTDCLELASRPVGELSGGEQQRVLLARALAQDTPVLLLDEPTTHLDLHHQAGLLKLVRSLATTHQIAVLMVLHDLNLAGVYADRIALLDGGRIQAVGKPSEVLTSERLSNVYRMPVQVVTHPQYGSPLVLPGG